MRLSCVLAVLVHCCCALQLPVASAGRALAQAGAPQIAKPKTSIKQKTFSNSPGDGGGGGAPSQAIARPQRKQHTEDMPLWKVILLGDEEYEEDPVCKVILLGDEEYEEDP